MHIYYQYKIKSKDKNMENVIEALKCVCNYFKTDDIYAETPFRHAKLVLKKVGFEKLKGNIFIKRTTTDNIDSGSSKKLDIQRQYSTIKDISAVEMFNSFIKSQETPIDKVVKDDCIEFLNRYCN